MSGPPTTASGSRTYSSFCDHAGGSGLLCALARYQSHQRYMPVAIIDPTPIGMNASPTWPGLKLRIVSRRSFCEY